MTRTQNMDQPARSALPDPGSHEQATAVARLLPALMRQMFLFDKDPVNELPLTQLRVCALLDEKPQSMSALGSELGISLPAVTQLADRLERVGLVQRVTNDSDRRVRQLRLTRRGERIMRNRREGRVRCVLTVFQHLSPAARGQVLDALQVLMQACEAVKGPHENGA
jgi:DNA-binding MarR family transcriptional regulator